ncbi:protein-glutamine glutaminase family protein [Chryseolinea sp. H1M3-3]|uniref:protein-glutamine glutaminase family protein n=1 Tax=Chryseolinea sp. H1M3-3 TaxID=3034144 RepID=UPI0023ECFD1E|nr:protein-glutamine glutaminase family protein [Chryseolinea sp. H1M3-3]
MRTIFLTKLLVILITLTSNSQSKVFSITWSYGLAGGSKPSVTALNEGDAVSMNVANDLMKYFIENSKLDFKCIYNGCQNRAMVMSLMLQQKGIKHYKVWNFDPFKISIFNSQDALDVDDILGLKSNKILWDFHVAIAILAKNEETSKIDTLIIDPAFSSKPLKTKEWLSLQNSPNSYYTFLDPIWYNFVTLAPGISFTCSGVATNLNVPMCFPYLLTGDFYEYNSYNQKLIAEELATNDQITRATFEIINKLDEKDPRKKNISSVVSDYNSFKTMLQSETQINGDNPFYSYLSDYRMGYKNGFAFWTVELQKLNKK